MKIKVQSESENYISLQEATKYCNYSQEYLSLRARQGKLKAEKIGRNWVTKKEWIVKYLETIDQFASDAQHPILNKSEASGLENKEIEEVKKPDYPEVLQEEKGEPVISGKGEELQLAKNISDSEMGQGKKIEPLRFGFRAALVFVLIFAEIFYGQDSLKNSYRDLSAYVSQIQISESVSEVFSQKFRKDFLSSFDYNVALATANTNETFQETKNILGEYAKWIAGKPADIGKRINSIYSSPDNDFSGAEK